MICIRVFLFFLLLLLHKRFILDARGYSFVAWYKRLSFANIYISARLSYTYVLPDLLLLLIRSLLWSAFVLGEASWVGQDADFRVPLTKYEIACIGVANFRLELRIFRCFFFRLFRFRIKNEFIQSLTKTSMVLSLILAAWPVFVSFSAFFVCVCVSLNETQRCDNRSHRFRYSCLIIMYNLQSSFLRKLNFIVNVFFHLFKRWKNWRKLKFLSLSNMIALGAQFSTKPNNHSEEEVIRDRYPQRFPIVSANNPFLYMDSANGSTARKSWFYAF